MRLGLLAPAIARRHRGILLFGGATPDPLFSSLILSANVVTANDSSTVNYTATAKDASGTALGALSGVTADAVAWVPLSTILAECVVSCDPTITSDGVDTATITVQIGAQRNGVWYPWAGVLAADLGVAVTGSGNTIAPLSGTTNASGIITTTFTTTQAATVKTVSATLFTQAITDTATCESDGTPSGTSSTANFDAGTLVFASGDATWGGSTQTSVSTTQKVSGTHSLKFAFVGHPTDDDRAEQRFSIGSNVTQLWVDFQLYVPSNYVHRDGPSSDNNKFFRLWGDDYNAANKVGCSTYLESSESRIYYEYVYYTYTNQVGRGPGGVPGARSDPVDFATGDYVSMVGTWTRIRLHFKMPTAAQTDGEFRMWYGNTLVETFTSIPGKYDSAIPYWNTGYFLGAANSGFTDNTDFFIDDVVLHTADPSW